MDEKATNEIDYGYDAYGLDEFPNDMYLLNGNEQLVIEGEGYFDINATYPIGVKANKDGEISFNIDALENIDPQQPLFIYDDENKTYNDIRTQPYKTTLIKGKNHNRFSLRFTDKTLSVNDNNNSLKDLTIHFTSDTNTLTINNQKMNMIVEKVTLFNITGQTIGTWEVKNQDQKNIQILFKNSSIGVYITKIKTSTGIISKKIIKN
jgi:hypothetical protein